MIQEFTQSVEDTIQARINEIHTAIPAEIVSFNAEKAVATVKPLGKYKISDTILIDYPQISDVPVVIPVSASVGVAFPVKPGDSCLIIVSEVELDKWRTGSDSQGSIRYDLTSAIAIPGLLKKGNSLLSKACKSNAVVIGSGANNITVSATGIEINGNIKVNGKISATGTIKENQA